MRLRILDGKWVADLGKIGGDLVAPLGGGCCVFCVDAELAGLAGALPVAGGVTICLIETSNHRNSAWGAVQGKFMFSVA
jgi:hypothetical protein